MSLGLEEQQDRRTAGYVLQTWNHQRVCTADMEPSEAGRTSLVKPISINALKTVSGRSSTVPEASNVQVIVVTSPVIPVFRVRHR